MTPRHPRNTRGQHARRTMAPGMAAAMVALSCGALLLAGCTAKPQVQASQSATERQLVFAHAEDATSMALAGVYVGMLDAAGIKAVVGNPVPDPVAEVLAGKADVAIAGTGDLLTALQKIPGNEPSPAPTSAVPGAPGGQGTGSTGAGNKPLTADQTLEALRELKLGDYALLDPAEAHRTGTLVTTAATSAGKDLNALAQLPALCPELVFGVPDALNAGLLPELQESYNCIPARVLPVEPTSKAPMSALIGNQVQVLATTAENAGISDNGLVTINDAQQLFPPQVLTPLITTREIGQDAIDAINKVSGTLKQVDLIGLNRTVTGSDALAPDKAAADWLIDKSLVAKP